MSEIVKKNPHHFNELQQMLLRIAEEKENFAIKLV